MKVARLFCISAIIIVFSNLLPGQTAPNLENGWKSFGSYDSTHLDTVNLMNGSLIFHGPLTPDPPQRGSIKVSNVLYSSSKDWQAICTTPPNSGMVCNWQKGGAGVIILPTPGLSVHRTRNNSFFGGQGTSTTAAAGYTLVTADQSTHQLYGAAGIADANGEATQFDSLDLSGFHVALSVPDSTGVLSQVTVTDRSGTQYQGTFHQIGTCGRAPTNFMISVPGPVQPMIDDAPAGEQYCPEVAFATLVTDSNGNQVGRYPGSSNPWEDTLGRTPPLTTAAVTTDFTDCVSSHAISAAMLYHYQDPNGIARNIEFCAAEIPIHTAFGQTANPSIGEAITSTDPSSGLHYIPMVTAVLDDKTKWTFDYDNYGQLISVGLPTGGSISYTWITTTHLPCNDGTPSHFSRAVATRTLNDGQGHTYQWIYNWGTISSGSMTNVVTDPAGNDTVHIFSDLSLRFGSVPSCSFYETSTIQYQGAQAANHPIQRVDTSYSAAYIPGDVGNAAPANVFATDVVTTLYPSGKAKKIHKDPDAGLGPGLPIFGNVKKELEYDWGQGQPGPLLRETDTTYQWEINSAYLTAHLLDLPQSVIIKDGSGCALSETDYMYDEATYFTPTTVSTQHVAAPNPAPVRGNLSTVTRWLAPTSSCNPKGGTAITSHTNWYDTGEPHLKIDALGHTATLSYDSAYASAYVTQTCSPQTGSATHCVSGTYDFNTGVLTSLTNENATTQAVGSTQGDSAHTSNFAYDSMFRLTSAQAPPDPANGSAQAQTSFNFSTPNVFPLSVQRTKSITTALSDSATNFFDGLGRVTGNQHVLPGGTAKVDTVFDPDGHLWTVSNPYFSASDPTYGITTNLYDALDRVTQTTRQDGSVNSVSYDQAAPGVAGVCTVSTDEAGKQRRACSDALGRLTEVDEPNPAATATWAQASVTINGSEQANPLPGAPGTGYVDISGDEGTNQVCTDPLPPRQLICNTVPDTGSVWIQIGSYPAKSIGYGSGSTAASFATALAAAFHNDPSAPADAAVSPTLATRVIFTARAVGASTNYTLAVGPGSDFWATPSGSTLAGGRDASSSPDTGTVTLTLNGTAYQTAYGGSDTASSIATRLASAITAGLWANASASGGVVNITAKSTGPGGDYSLSASSTYDTAHFGQPSFTAVPTASALTGGYDASAIDNQPFRTLYAYDALGNLLRVDQKGSAPNDSTQWRTRTFTYDSLSRLLTASNPEAGTVTYSYDLDGNLLQKTSPAPNQTGTATQTVSYCYDELHRVTGKGYGAQSCPLSTPVVTYAYDSGTNAIGKLTSLTDQAGTASYTYDILGRLTAETRTLTGANNASISKNLSYEYNLDGSLYKLHYPSGNVVTYAPGAAGLTLSAIDSGSGINYVTGATYGPDSALTGFVSGNSGTFSGITNAFSFNKRLQPANMSASAPGQTIFSIGYDFHVGNGISGADNGNVFGITNYKDTTRNQTFTYDPLNRLASAQNAGTDCTVNVLGGNKKFWGNTYTYDAWGNLLNKTKVGTACAGENLSLTADAHNWIHATGGSDYQYDAAGNMTFNATPPTQTYTYDQENRLTGAAGYAYTYDADGNRVRKSSSSSTGTLYWYMTPGIVGESDLSGNLTDEYVFFDGERVARKSTNGVFYYFSDHLKTASVITDASGNIKSESDYYPWGGELQFVNNDSNHYKFTGKERDGETQLDYFGARYYSNGLGRWVSADWSPTPIPVPYADFGNPQSLNLYGFVGGSPASKADPDGHCCSLSEVVDFVGGVSQGIVASASFGAVGAPKSSDSNASLLGQALGTAIEGAVGTGLRNTGVGAVGVGLVAEAPSAGTSTAVVVTGAVGVVAGGAMEAGAAKNVGGILNAMSGKRQGDFKSSKREEAIQNNADKNGGTNKCEKCGQDLQRTPNKAGQTPPKNQLHVHHDPPIKDGGGKDSTPVVVCRDCHQNEIHGKAEEQR